MHTHTHTGSLPCACPCAFDVPASGISSVSFVTGWKCDSCPYAGPSLAKVTTNTHIQTRSSAIATHARPHSPGLKRRRWGHFVRLLRPTLNVMPSVMGQLDWQQGCCVRTCPASRRAALSAAVHMLDTLIPAQLPHGHKRIVKLQ